VWRKYGPGEVVPAGQYLRNDTWGIVSLPTGGVLPEGEDVRYHRVPLPVLLLLGPVAGLIWLFAYPLIILLFICHAAAGKVLSGLAWAFRRASQRFATPYSHNDG